MNIKYIIVVIVFAIAGRVSAQQNTEADFIWGNSHFYNLTIDECIFFKQLEVKLLKIEKHYNQVKIGNDTLWLKVARHSLPEELSGIRIYVADNKIIKSLTPDDGKHGLLKGDALICLSDLATPLLNPSQFVFPVSFNDGFRWTAEEDSYPLSFYRNETRGGSKTYYSYPGLGIDLHDARANQKHWLVAVEDSRVVWVHNQGNEATVLLESKSLKGIYYMYSHLFSNNVAVKKGQDLIRGDVIGTAWGDKSWGHTVVSVVKPGAEPLPGEDPSHVINAFPHWFELYFQKGESMSRFYTRGRVTFGRPAWVNGNRKNTGSYNKFTGKGWLLGRWNPADRVEWETHGENGVARLSKTLFEGTPAQCTNPLEYYEYVINVRNGTYRIRAKVGDINKPSWQKIEYEGVSAGTKSLDAGEQEWTAEWAVKVTDGTLNIRIHYDAENLRVAAISEIVFQQAY